MIFPAIVRGTTKQLNDSGYITDISKERQKILALDNQLVATPSATLATGVSSRIEYYIYFHWLIFLTCVSDWPNLQFPGRSLLREAGNVGGRFPVGGVVTVPSIVHLLFCCWFCYFVFYIYAHK